MKKIEIIIKPGKYEAVRNRLIEAGVSGMTVTHVEGYGFQKKQIDVLKGKDVSVDFSPRVKIEIVLDGGEVKNTIDSVIDVSRTGRLGDGKIFIYDVSGAVRIRTGEKDRAAL